MPEELKRRIEMEVLPLVRKPARYTGGELNSVRKTSAEVNVALCFPEMYEIGMSNYGFILLYHLINDMKWASCERAFAPWPDMEEALRERGLPLYGLESFTPLREFDVVGFSLSYEMTYVNVLTMLDLSGIPLRSAGRGDGDPLVIAGGCCTVNPEPVADFFDAMVVGEGEEVAVELLSEVRRAKKEGAGRKKLLERLAAIDGVYVPGLCDTAAGDDGLSVVSAARECDLPVRRRFVRDLAESYLPGKCIVPTVEAIHDRINIEIFRGCVQGCRYCQAGMIYRPHRERPPERLVGVAKSMYRATGCDEVSLLSLNAPDYTGMGALLDGIMNFANPNRVSISMPSTRADTFSEEVGEKLRAVRGTGLTIAPEAGSQRLRDAINKRITTEDIERAMRSSFNAGWKKVKLYFMIGLPTETREDVDAMIDLVERLSATAAQIKGRKGKSRGRGRKQADFNLSISNFVPKPHTPFQWEPMNMISVLREKQEYLLEGMKRLPVKIDFHDPEMSFLETVFARGDRRLSAAIEAAWRLGARLDGWSENFNPDTWRRGFEDAGLNPEDYAYSALTPGAKLPWSHIATGISEKYLLMERRRAFDGATTGSCQREGCTGCGLDC